MEMQQQQEAAVATEQKHPQKLQVVDPSVKIRRKKRAWKYMQGTQTW